jgi:CBS domain containing-hemolysin-like protein
MAHLGRIPVVGDVVELDGVRYEVEQVTGRAVDSVLVELPADVQLPAEVTEDDPTSAAGPD